MHRPTLRQPLLVLAAALCVTATLIGAQLGSAAGASTAPAGIIVTGVSSTFAAPTGTPTAAVPRALVAKGVDFTVSVRFVDSTGAPTSYSSDTRLVLTANTDSQNQPVEVNWTAPQDAQTATLTTRLELAANQVTITVTGPKRSSIRPSGTSQPFDVLDQIRGTPSSKDTALTAGIGGSDGNCSDANRDHPVCGVAVLPRGAISSAVLLSLGACDTTSYANCGSTKGSVVQVLADLDEVIQDGSVDGSVVDLYSKTSPATILMKCDKSLCGGKGIQQTTLNFSSAGNGNLVKVDPCPAKNTIGSAPVCVDYVQSTRDNAGDTILFLLFTKDARVSVR